MNAKRWIECGAALVLGALLLYAGWLGTWLPLQLAAAVLALNWAWRKVPLLLGALLFWPNSDR